MRLAYSCSNLADPTYGGIFMDSEFQTMNGQNKLTLWAEHVSVCRSSDLSVRVWCKENDICKQTYYRWQRKLYGIAKAQQEQSRFAEISLARVCSGKAAVTVRIAGTEVDIRSGADAVTVETVLWVAGHQQKAVNGGIAPDPRTDYVDIDEGSKKCRVTKRIHLPTPLDPATI